MKAAIDGAGYLSHIFLLFVEFRNSFFSDTYKHLNWHFSTFLRLMRIRLVVDKLLLFVQPFIIFFDRMRNKISFLSMGKLLNFLISWIAFQKGLSLSFFFLKVFLPLNGFDIF